jgi:hypothetical protein
MPENIPAVTAPAPPPTQVAYPWRTTLRTAVQALVGALPLILEVLTGLHLDTVPAVAQFMAVTATAARIMARPDVHAWLERWAPWLLPAPPAEPISTAPTNQAGA